MLIVLVGLALGGRSGEDVAAGGGQSTPIEAKMLKCTPIWDELGNNILD
jgi:hypothetical protein